MSDDKSYVRTKYIVDKNFQYKYTLLIAGLGVLTYVFLSTLMYLKISGAAGSTFSPVTDYEYLLFGENTKRVLLGIGFFVAAIFIMLGIVITHRIAGPIHYMKLLLENEKEMPIKLRNIRKNDEFQSFYETLRLSLEKRENEKLNDFRFLSSFLTHLEATKANRETIKKLNEFIKTKENQNSSP